MGERNVFSLENILAAHWFLRDLVLLPTLFTLSYLPNCYWMEANKLKKRGAVSFYLTSDLFLHAVLTPKEHQNAACLENSVPFLLFHLPGSNAVSLQA